MRFFISLITFSFLFFHSSISFADEASSNESTSSSTPCGSMFSSRTNPPQHFPKKSSSTLDAKKPKLIKSLTTSNGSLYDIDIYDDGSVDIYDKAYIPDDFNEIHDIVDAVTLIDTIVLLRNDGQVIVIHLSRGHIWPDHHWDIDGGYDNPPESFFRTLENLSNVRSIAAVEDSLIVVKNDGTALFPEFPSRTKIHNVKAVYTTQQAALFLKNDNTIEVRGNSKWRGGYSELKSELYDIEEVCTNYGAFVLRRKDGRVFIFGRPEARGDISSISDKLVDVIKIENVDGVNFVAYKKDGTKITWGPTFGKGIDRPNMSFMLDSIFKKTKYEEVNLLPPKQSSNNSAFGAIKEDGSKVYWGNPNQDAKEDSLQSSDVNATDNKEDTSSNNSAFGAIKEDGSKVYWGNPTENKKEDPSQSSSEDSTPDEDSTNN